MTLRQHTLSLFFGFIGVALLCSLHGQFQAAFWADVKLPIGTVRFLIAHPTTPLVRMSRDVRNTQINAYGPFLDASPYPIVLMGDFNATPWTNPYLQLIHDHKLYGTTLVSSWP